jgi:hypothetical protein
MGQIKTLDQVLAEYVRDVYLFTFGNSAQTAKILGIDRRTVSNYLNRFPEIRQDLEIRKDFMHEQRKVAQFQ